MHHHPQPRRIFTMMVVAFALVAATISSTALTAQPAAAATCEISSPNAQRADQVALSAGHARVWRLYQAFFLRQPSDSEIGYWWNERNGGASLSDIAYQFAQGPEFQNAYGNITNSEYIDLVYRNVLCRPKDTEGANFWLNLLDSGAITRWDMMINFVELEEYLRFTGTCHSLYPEQSKLASGCVESTLKPLASATLATDGYQAKNVTVSRLGGGTGTFKGVEVDLNTEVLSTGSDRCSVASINANWLVAAEKDQPNPGVLGIGVVDGRHVKNSVDRSDRGVLGLRFDPTPTGIVEIWPGDTLSADDIRLNSVIHQKRGAVLESWHASAEVSPYMTDLAKSEIVHANEWIWAAAGAPIIVDGQTDPAFAQSVAVDPYTYSTLRHTFIALDQDTGRAVFGGTSTLDVPDLEAWARTNGYEDLIKFDGGGSAEFNIGGTAEIASTTRDVPVWLGVGC